LIFSVGTILIDDSTGHVYVPNQGSNSIALRLNQTGVVQQFVDPDGGSCYGAMTIRDNVLYVLNNQTCKVLAFNAETADILWTSENVCNGNSATNLSPMLWNANNDGFYLSTGTVLTLINAMDGSVVWSVEFSVGSDSQLAIPIWSAYDNTVVVRSQQGVHKIFSNGTVWWSYSFISINQFPGQPAIDSNGNIYVSDRIGELTVAAFKLDASGENVWTTPFYGSWPIASIPVLFNDSYFIVSTSNGNILAFDTRTGVFERILNIADINNNDLSAQMVFSPSEDVLYAVSTSNGYIFAFDTTNLFNVSILWKANPGVNLAGRGGVSVALDGTIYLGGVSGNDLYATVVALGCANQQILAENGTCTCPAETHPHGDSCLRCQPNEIYDTFFGCSTCSAGEAPSSDKNRCETCPEGSFSNAGDAQCTICTADPTNVQCPQQPQTTNNNNTPKNNTSNAINLVMSFSIVVTITVFFATM
jgi:outer membrane protein assembly factor BamB